MNFYKRFMSDYAKKTSRLTLAQHGAYTLLLDEIYATEKPLPNDLSELCRICRAMNKKEQEAVVFVANLYFPVMSDGTRQNPRAMEEIDFAAPAMRAARENGAKGGRPKKEPISFSNENPVGFQDVTQEEPMTKPPHSLEEYQEAKASSSPASLPDCPHEAIIESFEKHLPTLPQPRKSLWRAGKNAPALKSRWRWVLTEKYETGSRAGQRMAETREEGIAWFDRFFAYVAGSDFLSGRKGNFNCDLGWMINQANFEKILTGKYENKKEAA